MPMHYEKLQKIITDAGIEHELEAHSSPIGSRARDGKRGLHLYGKKSVIIAGRKPQQTYVAGVIEQKRFVGFYFMPIYSHPGKFTLPNELREALTGKSCFHLKTDDPKLLKQLATLLDAGIALYKKEKWI